MANIRINDLAQLNIYGTEEVQELNENDLNNIHGASNVAATIARANPIVRAARVGWSIGTQINNAFREEIGEAVDAVFR